MSINFGTWLYEALTKLTDEHRKFFLGREDQRNRFWREERCTGLSSDALTLYALGLDEEPKERNYPRPRRSEGMRADLQDGASGPAGTHAASPGEVSGPCERRLPNDPPRRGNHHRSRPHPKHHHGGVA